MLRIDGARLWATIEEYGRIGGTARGGVSRLALSDEDRAARDRLRQHLAALGTTVSVDDLGNMYGRREGVEPGAAPVVLGSHLDSVLEGGRFDGALGVLAGLEVLHTLDAARVRTRRPIVLVNWTNEEGARFEPAMMASGAVAGRFTRDWVYARADREGRTFGAELERIGYRGDERHRLAEACAYLELHIEQGPTLEAAGAEVGLVDGIMGIGWYNLVLTGEADHAGPTPLPLRHDALLAAARVVVGVREIAERLGEGAVGTVGRLEVHPDIINVIPGRATLSVDLRHPRSEGLAAADRELRALVDRACAPERIRAELERFWVSEPTPFDPELVGLAEGTCAELGYRAMRITSAAGHDAKYMADRFPTTMLFVPCRHGKSHSEEEWAEPAAVERGANVLLQMALALAEPLT